MFANDVTNKGLISKIYQQFMQQQQQEKKNLFKNGQKTQADTSPEKTYRCQQAQEEMLSFANYLRNAGQNGSEAPPPLLSMALLKSLQIMNAEEGMEKREPSYTVGM